MFHVHRSNRLERLAGALAAEIAARPLPDPFEPEIVAVQGIGARSFLERELAERLGVFANVAMPFPEELFLRAVRWALGPAADGLEPLREGRLALAILDVLPGLLGRRDLAPVRGYVERGGGGRAMHAFARRIAHAFCEYALYRPELIAGWSASRRGGGWQPVLYRAALDRLEEAGGTRPAAQAEIAREALAALARGAHGAPARISLFGVASLPPLYVDVLAAVARHTEVHLYAASPSREFMGGAGPDGGNRLIAALGRLGRDFQGVLEESARYVEGDDLFEDPAPEGAGTILQTIQSDMLWFRRRGALEGCDAAPIGRDPGDWSVKVCACRGPLREVEAVRDEILAFAGAGAERIPADGIAVLAPDIAAYAPFIEAVFRGTIPFSLARAPAEGAVPLIDAATALLALTEARLTAAELSGFLSRPPVLRRLGLSSADLAGLVSAGIGAGARFGADAAHRARLGLPALDANTWRFALDRVLVGLAISPEGGRSWAGVHPWDGGSDPSAALALAGAVTEAISAIRELTAPRPIPAWCADLRRVVASVCDVDGEEPSARAAFEEAVAGLEEDASRAGCGVPVGAEAIGAELAARAPERGSRHGGGGGVVCADLSQMRGVPFRAIFLLGMDGGSFPRRGSPPSFDLMAAEPRPGDRSPRDEDRALFLEAILAARERLVIAFGAGPDVQKEALPSSVVSHLVDAVEDGFGPTAGAEIVVRQPVEPFSPALFAGEPSPRARLSSCDRAAFAAAAAALEGGGRAPSLPRDMAPLPIAAPDVAALDVRDLLAYFLDPCGAFCARVLGIALPERDEEPPEREPFSLDPLSDYAVGARALRRLLEGDDPAGLYARAAGAGELPVGAAGAIAFAGVCADAVGIADAVRREVGERAAAASDSAPISVRVGTEWGPCEVTGLVDGITPRGRVVAEFGRLNGKRLLRAWIPHLVACCGAGGEAARTVCFFRGEKGGAARIALEPVPGARELLERLVSIYWEGQRRPLPLFPATSHAFAAALLAPKKKRAAPGEAAALSKARERWGGTYAGAPGEGTSDAARILFGDSLPWQGDDGGALGFRRLALDVFGPALDGAGGAS